MRLNPLPNSTRHRKKIGLVLKNETPSYQLGVTMRSPKPTAIGAMMYPRLYQFRRISQVKQILVMEFR